MDKHFLADCSTLRNIHMAHDALSVTKDYQYQLPVQAKLLEICGSQWKWWCPHGEASFTLGILQ